MATPMNPIRMGCPKHLLREAATLTLAIAVAACESGFVEPPALAGPSGQTVARTVNRDPLVALYSAAIGPNWKRNDNWGSTVWSARGVTAPMRRCSESSYEATSGSPISR